MRLDLYLGNGTANRVMPGIIRVQEKGDRSEAWSQKTLPPWKSKFHYIHVGAPRIDLYRPLELRTTSIAISVTATYVPEPFQRVRRR